MRIDVSEAKSFKECKRKWAFGSRNFWNLRSLTPIPALHFGTLFHECLAELYLGSPLEKILETVNRELSDPAELRTMTAMLTGYAENVLGNDLAEYKVRDIEHHFALDIEPFKSREIQLCGSIDMLCEAKEKGPEGQIYIWGFEHKSCGRFRDPLYTVFDEQPRLYTVALKAYVDMLNIDYAAKHDGEYGPYVLGGIYLNEVKKVQRTFDHKRTTCVYSEEDMSKFLHGFFMTCRDIISESSEGNFPLPEPGIMKCTMCMYKNMCETYAYVTPKYDDVLDEFSEEFAVRETDHLDEKLERKGDEECSDS